jgi:hypothetical protein
MPSVGFETTISAGERPQTYALDRAATGTGIRRCNTPEYLSLIYIAILLCKKLTRLMTFFKDILEIREHVTVKPSFEMHIR